MQCKTLFNPLLIVLLLFTVTPSVGQEGNQTLDGIGETDLITRYIFSDDTKDWSRNHLNANLKGGDPSYVTDKKFEKVLALDAKQGTYIEMPADLINSGGSFSMAGWFKWNEISSGQYLLDWGTLSQRFFLATSRSNSSKGLQLGVVRGGRSIVLQEIEEPPVEEWQHLAVTVDVAAKNYTLFLNGRVQQAKAYYWNDLEPFLKNNTEFRRFNMGKSLLASKGNLSALLHDFRIYRVALSENQINRIYQNALLKGQTVVNERDEKGDDLPRYAKETSQLYNQFLIEVPEVEVHTPVGHLPRLPRYINGVYGQGIEGPKVRVQWPAPTDNTMVAQEGRFEVLGTVPGSEVQVKAAVYVDAKKEEKAPSQQLMPFSLNEVTLNADPQGQRTKFIANQEKFIQTLASTHPDSFLYMFRNAFGQDQPGGAVPLKGWDSQETKLRGHATGHYLTAIAQAFASTAHNPQLQQNFAQKMEYMIEVLHGLSQLSGRSSKEHTLGVADPTQVPPAQGRQGYDSDLTEAGIRTDYWNWGKGYLSAYPPDQFILLEKGATYGTQKSQIWAPYYTLHKILAGLLDVYEISGNVKALQTAQGMGDWVDARLSQVPAETRISMWNRYIAGEYGGMNQVLARLARLTQNEDYLETAKLFDNIKMFYGNEAKEHGLAKNVDTYRGLHANQHVPQIIGALEMYAITGETPYFKIADNFWYKTVNDYTYSIGGVAGARNPANAECFVSQPGTLYANGFSAGGQNETCATYNMLKLTNSLFLFEPNVAFMDYYERALYNHILASVAKDSPANTYHVPLRPGSLKDFGNADMNGFTCCNGTSLESNTKLQEALYSRSIDDSTLYVNLYVPSTLNWKQKRLLIHQKTTYPYDDQIELWIQGNATFTLKLRIPQWATGKVEVLVNDQPQNIEVSPGSYISLKRDWKTDDVVKVTIPFDFRLEPVMDQQNIASLFYGPILLAAQEEEPMQEWRELRLDAENLKKNIQGDANTLQFEIDGVPFRPFFDTYGHHSVYFNVQFN